MMVKHPIDPPHPHPCTVSQKLPDILPLEKFRPSCRNASLDIFDLSEDGVAGRTRNCYNYFRYPVISHRT